MTRQALDYNVKDETNEGKFIDETKDWWLMT